jgi:hypothetical protein
MQEKAKRTPLPWRVGRWVGQCHNPIHVKARHHSGPPECVYEPYFAEGYGGIAGPEPNQMVVDTHYDELVISDADAEFIVRACNAHDGLVAALKPFAEQKCYGAESGYAPHVCLNTSTCPTCVARAAIAKAEGR